MYKITTNIELPIAHCLYRGAYSGLCCGNVYRDLKNDGEKDRYELGDKVLPILHGHLYRISVDIESDSLNKNGMVIDFKEMKKILHEYFDQYDHSMILTPDNPLVKVYEKNDNQSKKKLFIWPENPTAEYMSKYWHDEVLKRFSKLNVKKLSVTVEETSHNSVTFTN